MAIIQQTATISINTDDFTVEQWKAFILENVTQYRVLQAAKYELFPFDYLKAVAIHNYQNRIDVKDM